VSHTAVAGEPESRRSPIPVIIYAVAVLAAIVLGFTGRRTDEGLFVLPGTFSEAGIPFAFVLFVLVLLGVAFFHHYTLWVALAGALVITLYTAVFVPGKALGAHFAHEAEFTILNLGGLLLGFALLAKFFERSNVPDNLPRLLPKKPLMGSFVLLAIVWFISSFLDNIAAAMIGGVIARTAFRGRVTVGYVAALVAASNAGGAWSVLGDTTTTMMWLQGVHPLDVAHCFIASAVALVVGGLLASIFQNRVQTIDPSLSVERKPIDGAQLLIVGMILTGAIAANFLFTGPWAGFFAGGPWYGVWAAILIGALIRRPAWEELPGALKGAIFLLSLVWCASLMPVKELPQPAWQTTFGLGFVSAVFDNIPLTKLAIEQDGYDWGMLAYAVGYGGSMIWFGSSAGVAISKDFPEARNTGRYLKEGWPVVLAYVLGFLVMFYALGWQPHPIKQRSGAQSPAPATAPATPDEPK
jgi:Na+/H+ antiporter NhaD/arsenite permease-like protein